MNVNTTENNDSKPGHPTDIENIPFHGLEYVITILIEDKGRILTPSGEGLGSRTITRHVFGSNKTIRYKM